MLVLPPLLPTSARHATTMKAGYFGFLVLQAVSTVLASPSPSTVQRDGDEVSRLAELAYQEAEKAVHDNELNKRAGEETCSWDKVRVRREWFVN